MEGERELNTRLDLRDGPSLPLATTGSSRGPSTPEESVLFDWGRWLHGEGEEGV